MAAPRPFDALLFDLDGTLYDERGGMLEALSETLGEASRLAPGIDVTLAARLYPEVGRRIWEVTDLGRNSGAPSSDEIRRQVWRALLGELGVSGNGLAEHLAGHYARERRRLHRLFPESLQVLAALRGRHRLGLLSNGASDLQREKLGSCGLSSLFDSILISAEVGVAKPDPEVFLRAAAGLGCEAGRVLHIGDNPTLDVAGALGAGLQAAWVNRAGERYPAGLPAPGYVMSDLTPLMEIVDLARGDTAGTR